jgi:signal transduction histidine kinase
MQPSTPSTNPEGMARIFAWRRLRPVLVVCFVLSLMLAPGWKASYAVLITRLVLIGSGGLLVFGLFERWPAQLPNWLARWVLQVGAVAVVMPFAAALAYAITTAGNAEPWYRNADRLSGFGMLSGFGVLLAPWVAMTALLRQRESTVRSQAQAFQLERSELERNALDARLRLLQAQVEPHFLFNTLANVRELVDSGSPQASEVLSSLIAYLRAAVPRLQETATTLGQEIELVRAYLELMHMRMPDRLQFALHVEESTLPLRCPPMSLLTLVENAVRHGIDPSEEGGRIEVQATLRDGRCRVRISDTGVGMRSGSDGLGTGMATLRERMSLAFRGDAALLISAVLPHGVCAELDFPAQRVMP